MVCQAHGGGRDGGQGISDGLGGGGQRWIDRYRHAGGRAGGLARRQGGYGQVARLTAEQQEAVAAEEATGRVQGAAAIGRWITERYGVTYRPGGLYDLLGRLRCHPKGPRPRQQHADPAAQAAWKGRTSPRRSRRPASRASR
jgi:transposase